MLVSCAGVARPSALCHAQDWQGLVVAALASFSIPKSADFRAYLLQTSAVFQCSLSPGWRQPQRGGGRGLQGQPRGKRTCCPTARAFQLPPSLGTPTLREQTAPEIPLSPSLARQHPSQPHHAHLSLPSSSSSSSPPTIRCPSPPVWGHQLGSSLLPQSFCQSTQFSPSIFYPLFLFQWYIWGQGTLAAPGLFLAMCSP